VALVIDLSEVTYMDLSCLDTLLRAQRRQDELGGTFGLQPSVMAQRLLIPYPVGNSRSRPK
jgi:anti-anti-sigma regulatory factor